MTPHCSRSRTGLRSAITTRTSRATTTRQYGIAGFSISILRLSTRAFGCWRRRKPSKASNRAAGERLTNIERSYDVTMSKLAGCGVRIADSLFNKSEEVAFRELEAITNDNALRLFAKPRLSDVILKDGTYLPPRTFD